VFQPTNGALRFQRTSPIGSSMGTTIAGLGDLDQDGTQEFALLRTTNGVTRIDCESGTGLFRRWSLPNLPGAIGVGGVAAIGDVDDDGSDAVSNVDSGEGMKTVTFKMEHCDYMR